MHIYILYIYVHYTCQQDRTLQGYRSVVAHNISGPTAYRPLWVKPLFSACDVSFSCSCHQWHESHLRNTSVDFEFKVWSFFDAPSLHFRNMGLTPLLLVAVSTIHLAKTWKCAWKLQILAFTGHAFWVGCSCYGWTDSTKLHALSELSSMCFAFAWSFAACRMSKPSTPCFGVSKIPSPPSLKRAGIKPLAAAYLCTKASFLACIQLPATS